MWKRLKQNLKIYGFFCFVFWLVVCFLGGWRRERERNFQVLFRERRLAGPGVQNMVKCPSSPVSHRHLFEMQTKWWEACAIIVWGTKSKRPLVAIWPAMTPDDVLYIQSVLLLSVMKLGFEDLYMWSMKHFEAKFWIGLSRRCSVRYALSVKYLTTSKVRVAGNKKSFWRSYQFEMKSACLIWSYQIHSKQTLHTCWTISDPLKRSAEHLGMFGTRSFKSAQVGCRCQWDAAKSVVSS